MKEIIESFYGYTHDLEELADSCAAGLVSDILKVSETYEDAKKTMIKLRPASTDEMELYVYKKMLNRLNDLAFKNLIENNGESDERED